MNVNKLSDNLKSCNNCKCIDETAYTVTIHNTTIILCTECKHDLSYDLMSN